jgi:hypothetical protein
MYTSSKEYPLQVVQEYPNDGKDWMVKTKVDSSDKLLEVNRQRRLKNGEKGKSARQSTTAKRGTSKMYFRILTCFVFSVQPSSTKEAPWATTIFQAPFHLQMRRLNKETNSTAFVSAFYICPVGVGRCRFMAAGLSKAAPPRWVTKLALDNFLDQDTYLLATQQQYILSSEAIDLRDMLKKQRQNKQSWSDDDDDYNDALKMQTMPTRRRLFCLSTPNDAFGAKLEQFWDATLLRSPNRIKNLLKLDSAGIFLGTPPRNVVLDRKLQHLDICPDSQAAIRICQKVRKMGVFVATVLLCTKFLFLPTMCDKYSLAQRWNVILRPAWIVAMSSLSLLVSFIAAKIHREYYFKYTDDYRRKDMNKIPKNIWKDV